VAQILKLPACPQADGTLKIIRRSEMVGTLADFPTRREARALFESRLHSLNDALQKVQSSILFRDFISSQWEPAILPTLKFATQRNYRHLVKRRLLPIFRDRPLCDIRRQHVQAFVTDKMAREQFTWKTSLHLRNLLSKISSTAVAWEYLQENPASGVKLPQRPLREPSAFLTRSEVACLLNALEDPERTLSAACILHAQRQSSLITVGMISVGLTRRCLAIWASH